MRFQGLAVAVTGGAGFIGSHLVDQLMTRGCRVVVIDNFATGRQENLAQHRSSDLKIVRADVRDLAAMRENLRGIEWVFHLATHCVRLSLEDPGTNHDVNATGTLNVLRAAKEAGVKRLVYCSSSEVYGNASATSGGISLNEESPKNPTTIYGASKLVGELYTLSFHQTYGLPCMVVRPFNAYGPRSHLQGAEGEVIPRFAVWIKAGLQPVIFGSGQQTRDFTYVEDTAAGIVAAATNEKLLGDTVNLAHGEEVSVLTLARILSKLNGTKFEPKFVDDRPGDILRLGADVGKARRLLGEVATTPIQNGLERYLKWLDSQNLDYAAIAKALTERNWMEVSR
jgi:UDP-glucose 4-epimerase